VSTPRQLSADEQAHVRAALYGLHARLGTWIATARAVRIKRATLRRVRDGGSAKLYLAERVARTVGITVADLRTGKFLPPGVPSLRIPRRSYISRRDLG
jgi:hypothetical protein